MNIDKDKVVQFHYTLRDAGGDMLESTQGQAPLAYLHGHGNIIPGLENAMNGKTVGEQFSVTVEPKEAYGERREGPLQRIALKHLQGARKWKPGMVAVLDTDKGYRQVTVVKVGKFNADVDPNHPLAGRTLVFDVQIVDVRDATPEEITHGHAHGAGGHQH